MYRFLAIGIIGAIIGFGSGWKLQGWRLSAEIAKIRTTHAEQMQKLQDIAITAEQEYREKERSYIISLTHAQEQRNEEVAAINQRHATLVHRLRQRPERIVTVTVAGSEVPSAPAACIGTTGAELARGDAEFLAGYAADAARLEAALNQCEAAYNALR